MTPAIEALKSHLDGRLIDPEDPQWDEARLAWNLSVDQRPAAVALPESADDVIAVVRTAREHGLRVAPQGTGHGASSTGSLEDAVLLKTHRMGGVDIDADNARYGRPGGCDLAGPSPRLPRSTASPRSPARRATWASSATRSAAGVGWMVRKHGLSCNSIAGAEVVTADGRLVTAGPRQRARPLLGHPRRRRELRGGDFARDRAGAGESFTRASSSGRRSARRRSCPAWRDWTADLPEEMTSLGRLLNVPPFPEIPEPIRGRSFVVVEAAFLGDEAAGADLLAPLRELGPEMDTFASISPPGLAAVHNDPPEPVPGAGDGLLLDSLTDEAVDLLVRSAGHGSGTPLLSVEIRHLGGAVGRPDPEGGALDHIAAGFAVFSVGMAPTPEMKAGVNEALDGVRDAFAGCRSSIGYINFADRPTDVTKAFPPGASPRLAEVKRTYDPDDVFQSNHPIAPTA